jgi:(2Fe-2S) ferredoxin
VAKLGKVEKHVLVCEHKDCEKRGGRDVYKSLKGALKETGLRERVMVSRVGCFDQCDDGPVVVVYPEGVWYGRVDERAAREIVGRQVGEGRTAPCKVLRDLREPAARRE